jgi:alanyl-tRNA synthetase
MIKLAESIISRSPKTTVILVSRSGDVVGMSKVVDIVKEVKEFCAAHGGSGGGKGALAQGKIDPKKLKG